MESVKMRPDPPAAATTLLQCCTGHTSTAGFGRDGTVSVSGDKYMNRLVLKFV